jgi:hypothetical protein
MHKQPEDHPVYKDLNPDEEVYGKRHQRKISMMPEVSKSQLKEYFNLASLPDIKRQPVA